MAHPGYGIEILSHTQASALKQGALYPCLYNMLSCRRQRSQGKSRSHALRDEELWKSHQEVRLLNYTSSYWWKRKVICFDLTSPLFEKESR